MCISIPCCFMSIKCFSSHEPSAGGASDPQASNESHLNHPQHLPQLDQPQTSLAPHLLASISNHPFSSASALYTLCALSLSGFSLPSFVSAGTRIKFASVPPIAPPSLSGAKDVSFWRSSARLCTSVDTLVRIEATAPSESAAQARWAVGVEMLLYGAFVLVRIWI